MKKRILLCLIAIFIFLSAGVALSILFIEDTTDELKDIIGLHEVEGLRRSLVISLQTVQTNLYAAHTPHAQDLDSIISNVNILNSTAAKCTSCHHSRVLTDRIINIQSLIKDYETHISYYLTGSANKERMMRLKDDAVIIGEKILSRTEQMSHNASNRLTLLTSETKKEIEKIKRILLTTILVCLMLGVIVAIILTRSVTNPVGKLLDATRRIESGQFGTKVEYKGSNEFGELARHFNLMSAKIHDEVTERLRSEENLKESEERYALSARGSNDGLWDYDLINHNIYFSPRWKAMLGFSESEIGSDPDEWLSRIHTNDRNLVESEINAHIKGLTPQFQSEHRILHNDGTYRWMLTRGIAVRDEAEKAYRMAGSQTDITERKSVAEQLLHDAFHDALTGIPNRALFMDRLSHVIKRSSRDESNSMFAVLFIDLDRFKVVNDSLGHRIGDKLLVQVSSRLQESFRPGDTVARFGGDEFAVLLEDIKEADSVTRLLDRIGKDLAAPFVIDEHEVYMTSSIGISFSNVDFKKPDDLIRNADIAMYHAKTLGRDRYVIFSPDMYDTVVDSMKLETDLRHAVENNEFELFYQPIVSSRSGKITGFEALIRWQHPVRGLVTPDMFIPMSEETGLIVPIGSWAVEEACRQINIWQNKYKTDQPLTVSVNVSSKQFTPELVTQVRDSLERTGIKGETLILEITETILLEHSDTISPILSKLKELDIKLHIDDFGTGYSSLSYLHDYPIDALKIDRSFVSKVDIKGDRHKIAKTITELAKNLNMQVTAEGVETEEQLARIRDLDCEHIQGFLFSKPLNSKGIEILLQQVDKSYFS